MAVKNKAQAMDDKFLLPVISKTGIEMMSINLLLENEDDPVVWRGPVIAGAVPDSIYPLVSRICGGQEMVARACRERNLEIAFLAFANDQLVTIPLDKARKMFIEMIENTKEYLTMYDLSLLK